MKQSIEKILIQSNLSIASAIKKLTISGLRCLIVIDKKRKYLGTVTDGDIRKEILKNKDFSKKITHIYNSNSIFFYKKNFNELRAKKLIKDRGIPLIPIINKKSKPIDYYNLFDYLDEKRKKSKNNKVIIMAGGEGKRLQPFTSILPKPLIPVKGKPVLTHIMNLFKNKGFNNFLISINSKNKVLKSYLNELSKNYDIDYIQEDTPLGTAGSLKKIKGIQNNFFVINCDNLFSIDPKSLLNFHEENKCLITVVISIKKHNIPYGVCKINKKKGTLLSMEEKPINNILANTGLYVCSNKVLNYLPNKKKFNMTEVINNILKRKLKTGVFPIKGSDWKDTGNWLDYIKIIQKKNK